jgi:hypothetical protein
VQKCALRVPARSASTLRAHSCTLQSCPGALGALQVHTSGARGALEVPSSSFPARFRDLRCCTSQAIGTACTARTRQRPCCEPRLKMFVATDSEGVERKKRNTKKYPRQDVQVSRSYQNTQIRHSTYKNNSADAAGAIIYRFDSYYSCILGL